MIVQFKGRGGECLLFGIEQLVRHCSESPAEQQVMQPLEQECS